MDVLPFLTHNWALVLIALVSGGLLLWPGIAAGAGGGLTPDGAVQLINREKAIVVDVSEAEEFATGHIRGARNVPVNELPTRLPEVAKNKTVPLILVCPSGARAKRALGVVKGLGYDKAVVLGGGLKAWRDANLPLEKA
ncbi:rhodanese-like domain-containing protein [Ramlibacter alkalitolerans]|uniref:Rhodanese-like domain-containing protein n=1 Tax=Ramlibacter alkalitolerans TaxID=2039631 RepID=A0ABS1JPY9_9BURK|nr:rhodanese-like domain-containing protein [Ramlibacter alkalitolerans]MBL0426313.1 rhodanese-like domain-containing protein [Ramlibacter alkalitolerans]